MFNYVLEVFSRICCAAEKNYVQTNLVCSRGLGVLCSVIPEVRGGVSIVVGVTEILANYFFIFIQLLFIIHFAYI